MTAARFFHLRNALKPTGNSTRNMCKLKGVKIRLWSIWKS